MKPAANAGDDDDKRALRAAVVGAMGRIGRDRDVLKHARRLVEQELDKPGAVDPTLLNVLVNVAPLDGDAALYDKYVARSRSAVDPEEQYRYLYGLASFSDPALVRRTFDYAVGPDVRSQDTKNPGGGVAHERATRDAGVGSDARAWDAIQKKTGEFVGNTVIVGRARARSATDKQPPRSRRSSLPIRCRTPRERSPSRWKRSRLAAPSRGRRRRSWRSGCEGRGRSAAR